MHKKLQLLLSAIFFLICFFCALTTFSADKPIILLYTNDVHCAIDDNLGYAKVSQYKHDLAQKTPYIALIDAGDAIQGAPIGKLSEGESIIDIMNFLGYDFAIPGNHEFDYSMNRFFLSEPKIKLWLLQH